MEQTQIEEGNRLIAEFDGWEQTHKIDSVVYNKPKWYHRDRNWSVDITEAFKYHTNCNWLMPVVEKVEAMDGGIYSVFIVKNECDIAFSTKYNPDGSDIDAPSFKQVGTTKIEAVWLAVVEFIKWHNAN